MEELGDKSSTSLSSPAARIPREPNVTTLPQWKKARPHKSASITLSEARKESQERLQRMANFQIPALERCLAAVEAEISISTEGLEQVKQSVERVFDELVQAITERKRAIFAQLEDIKAQREKALLALKDNLQRSLCTTSERTKQASFCVAQATSEQSANPSQLSPPDTCTMSCEELYRYNEVLITTSSERALASRSLLNLRFKPDPKSLAISSFGKLEYSASSHSPGGFINTGGPIAMRNAHAIVSKMLSYPLAVALQTSGALALEKLVASESTQHGPSGAAAARDEILRVGGLDALLVAMTTHASVGEVQIAVCVALERLCQASASCLQKQEITEFRNGAVIEAVVGALRGHCGSHAVAHSQPRPEAVLAERACSVLAMLGVCDTGRSRITQAGGIEAVVAVLKYFQDSPAVVAKAFAALCSLAFMDAANKEAIATHYVALIVSILRKHEAVASVQEEGCGLLRNLASKNEKHKGHLAEAGAVAVALAAMGKFMEHVRVVRAACGTLLNLAAAHPENQKLLVALGVVPTIRMAMELHGARHEELSKCCTQLLSLLE